MLPFSNTEGVMNRGRIEESAKVAKFGVAKFGRRRIAPRVCVVDSKQHIRTFLREALEEFGFITCECVQASDFDAVLETHLPSLVHRSLMVGHWLCETEGAMAHRSKPLE
jgi:PleD family two-component response regulator